MTFEGLLFDSRGEIGRRDFWFAHLFLFPMEVGAAFLFRVDKNELCTQDPSTFLGKSYYVALAIMAFVFLFMWYCVVIKRLRKLERGHKSFFAYAIPILLTLSALAPHFPLPCTMEFSSRLMFLAPLIPFWLIYFVDLGIMSHRKPQPDDESDQPMTAI